MNCGYNQLSNLDVSQNTALTELYCYVNNLTSLDVSKNTNLTSLECGVNKITSLDISQNKQLTLFTCDGNLLTHLNIKNGKNNILQLLFVHYNPNLTCIQVDDAAANHTGWQKDATANYNENCLGTLSSIDFDKKEISIFPNPVKEILHFSEEVSNIKIMDISGRMMKQPLVTGKSVNVSHLAKGIYLITATTKAGKTITQKLIKD